jgi:hypothetical protein
MTITKSGPSGRRGFDGDQVLNIRAVGFGHSDLFSVDKRVENGLTYLANSYQKYWRPFLTLPATELLTLSDRADPQAPWSELPWPLRGTIFPFLAVPLVFAAASLLIARIGESLWSWRKPLLDFSEIIGSGLVLLFGWAIIIDLWRNRKGRHG